MFDLVGEAVGQGEQLAEPGLGAQCAVELGAGGAGAGERQGKLMLGGAGDDLVEKMATFLQGFGKLNPQAGKLGGELGLGGVFGRATGAGIGLGEGAGGGNGQIVGVDKGAELLAGERVGRQVFNGSGEHAQELKSQMAGAVVGFGDLDGDLGVDGAEGDFDGLEDGKDAIFGDVVGGDFAGAGGANARAQDNRRQVLIEGAGEHILKMALTLFPVDAVGLAEGPATELDIVGAGEEGPGVSRFVDFGADGVGGLGDAGDAEDAFGGFVDELFVAFIDDQGVFGDDGQAEPDGSGADARAVGLGGEQAEDLALVEQNPAFLTVKEGVVPVGPLLVVGGFEVKNAGEIRDRAAPAPIDRQVVFAGGLAGSVEQGDEGQAFVGPTVGGVGDGHGGDGRATVEDVELVQNALDAGDGAEGAVVHAGQGVEGAGGGGGAAGDDDGGAVDLGLAAQDEGAELVPQDGGDADVGDLAIGDGGHEQVIEATALGRPLNDQGVGVTREADAEGEAFPAKVGIVAEGMIALVAQAGAQVVGGRHNEAARGSGIAIG